MALVFPAPAQIKNLLDPTANTDAATKKYVDNAISGGGQDISAGNVVASGNVSGNVLVANYFTGDGSNISSITGANITGTVANANYAAYAGNITIASQPNITSVGTLANLIVSGDANIQGNLTVGGTFTYINTTTVDIEDPIIQLGAGANGATLTSNNGYDRGTLLHNFTTAPVDAFMGWKTANNEFVFASNATVSSGVITINTLGNISAGNANLGNLVTSNYFVGNGSMLTGMSQLTSTVDNYTGDGTTVSYALSATPNSVNYTIVTVQGVVQPRSYYSLSVRTLTFTTSPPSGSIIEITTLGGSVSPPASSNNLIWIIASSATTLSAGTGYFVDTSSGPLTLTLPSSHSLGDTIKIDDLTGSFGSNNLTINGNGSKIQGSASNWISSTNQANFTLVYSNSTYGWKVLA